MSEENNKKAVQKHEAIIAKKAMFQKHADDLTQRLDGILYVMIATDDGFPVAFTGMDEKNAAGRAALAASLEGLGDTVAFESSLQNAQAIHVECQNGFIFNRNIEIDDKNLVLLIASNNELTLATLLWHIKKMVDDIVRNFHAA